MCGRYYRRCDKKLIAEYFRTGTGNLADLSIPDTDYNVAPSTLQPVIRQSRVTGERELVLMKWGLVPFFAKSPKDFNTSFTINAKAETLTTKPIWRCSFMRRRCLIPVSGYYEWRKLDSKTKQPWRYELTSAGLFALAGLWDTWKDKANPNRCLKTYTIVTTDANELVAQVHDRMPLILHPRDYDRWLNRSITAPPELPIDLLRPYLPDEMDVYLANPLV